MIKIDDLSFAYQKNNQLFNHFNLNMAKGGVYGLLGKNGAGKTTLLNLLSGFIFPKAGNLEVLGHQPKQRKPSFLKEIYFLSESLYAPNLTINKYVNYFSPFYPSFNDEILQTSLNEFTLGRHGLLNTLSFGQKKKFFIAFGLATCAKLLMLDEPTNGLDIPSKAQFRKLLASTVTEDKIIIISTHQVHDIENLIDSVVILDEGKTIFHQSIEAITERLTFSHLQHEPSVNQCLYYEKQVGGYSTVTPNTNKEESNIDLEILFNAIITQQNQIQTLFSEVVS